MDIYGTKTYFINSLNTTNIIKFKYNKLNKKESLETLFNNPQKN